MKTALFLLVLGGFLTLQAQPSLNLVHSEGPADTSRALGRSLFTGGTDLHGRMYLHPSDLPPEVVRCGNCHSVANGPAVERSTAPRLTPELLLRQVSRRGGPPSAYDGATFCTMLRKGTDPAHVVIDVEMPRYSITDAECAALWSYLTESAHDMR